MATPFRRIAAASPIAAGALAATVSVMMPDPAAAQANQVREFAEREWAVKAQKMARHLQPLMRKHGIDLWIIMSHENHPDPVLDLFGGNGVTGWYGHRNAYLIRDPGGEQPLDRVAIGTHLSAHLEPFFPEIVGYGEEGLTPRLREYVHDADPRRIAINQSRTISMADGISAALKEYLVEAIGPAYSARLVSSEPLVIDYVSVRTPEELEIAQEASWRTWNIMRRALSNEVVTPGKTRLMDVHWWIVREWRTQGLDFNFPPGLSIRRQGVQGALDDADDPVIQPGDVVHIDFGVRLAGVVTDQQKLAYVLKPGETEAPAGLRRVFAQSVRMADIVRGELRPGRLGRDVKAAAEERGRAEGIESLVYSHSQGNWVHGAGAWAIFDWPQRYGTHPREPVRTNEFWSIEFSVTGSVPEWGDQRVGFGREEDAWVDAEGRVRWMAGPQKELWLIRSGRPVSD